MSLPFGMTQKSQNGAVKVVDFKWGPKPEKVKGYREPSPLPTHQLHRFDKWKYKFLFIEWSNFLNLFNSQRISEDVLKIRTLS